MDYTTHNDGKSFSRDMIRTAQPFSYDTINMNFNFFSTLVLGPDVYLCADVHRLKLSQKQVGSKRNLKHDRIVRVA